MTRNNKAVAQYKDGKLVAKYMSITLASNMTNTQQAHIGKVCSGKRGTAGGSKWKFVRKMGETLTPSVMGVSQYSDDTLLAVYSDSVTASDITGIKAKDINKVLSNIRKTAGGFVWG